MVATLRADGLDADIPTRTAINTTTNMEALKHPHNVGHQELASAFLLPLQ